MSRYVFKLPDLGEGIVSSEIVAWRVKPGDTVREDDPLVDMATDKAVVEVPSPASGTVVTLGGKPGDVIPVGAELAVIESATPASGTSATAKSPSGTSGSGTSASGTSASKTSASGTSASDASVPGISAPGTSASATSASSLAASGISAAGTPAPHASTNSGSETAPTPHRIQASPSTRRKAKLAGVDLSTLKGTGPGGRIRREDLDSVLLQRTNMAAAKASGTGAPSSAQSAALKPTSGGMQVGDEVREEVPVIGIRRVIAQRMAEAKRTIPHFSYVEEVDVTELEALRIHLNASRRGTGPSLTYLPFIILAMVRAIEEFPQINARYDAARESIMRLKSVHVGIATQTPDGLKVPVVRHAQHRRLWDLAGEIARVSEAARTNQAKREELIGSTITLTSLGKLGGIATTPVINSPEVAILGVNRAVERPVVHAGQITIRRMMNLSSSFDHRFVDGYDAAAFIQALKTQLEHPALIFVHD